jgi:hypothetical protein
MKALRIRVVVIMVIGLASCVTIPLTMDEIQGVRRGMEHESFQTDVAMKPRLSFTVQLDDATYSVEVYPMQTGTQTVMMPMTTGVYPNAFTTMVAHTVPVSEDYLFTFTDNRLVFWGFMAEYQKADDALVRRLAPQISEKYEKAKEQEASLW